ncbi:MAG TPA: DUF5947 family protein [Thermoleophilaceae bacterium]|jgi:hypothetical protein
MSERRLDLEAAAAGRRRAAVVSGLRTLARAPGSQVAGGGGRDEHCDLCQGLIPGDHRHLLNLHERQIACVCESCFAIRSGDPDLRPVGQRTVWLEGFEMPDDVWAQFRIPIGLAFFMFSSVTECVVALYPSPAGATESELHFESWNRLVALNPVLERLEPDGEALIVNRMSVPHAYAIAPIDRCYMLVGLVKSSWQGISGGIEVERAVDGYFDELRGRAVVG